MKNTDNAKDIAKDNQAAPANGTPPELAKADMAPVPGTAPRHPNAEGEQPAGRPRTPQSLLDKISAKAAQQRLSDEDEDEEEELTADEAETEEDAASDEAPADSVDTGAAAADAPEATEQGEERTQMRGEGTTGGFLSGIPPIVYALGAAGIVGGGIAIFRDGGGDTIAAPDAKLANDTGASATDFITKDGTIDVSGIVTGNTWEYSTDGGATWQAGSGTSFTLAEGTYAAGSVQVRQKDAGGQTGEVGKIAGAITVDATAPEAPAIDAVTGDDVVDRTEAEGPVSVSGTGEAGSTLTVNWGDVSKTVTVGADGTWTAEFAASEVPANGSYAITASAVDAAGNTSETATHDVVVDRQNYITGTVSAGPVVAGLEVKAYTEDGTLLASGVTDASGSFRIGYTDYSGLVLVSVVDPDANSEGFIDEATGEQTDLTVMLRAVKMAEAGEDLVINITPLTEVATRLMAASLNSAGVTDLTGVDTAAVLNANALVAKLFTDQPDTLLTSQELKLVIDAAGADTSDTASIYGVYLAAIQGWSLMQDQTLEETIAEIVALLQGSQSLGGAATRPDLGLSDAQKLADILEQGFETVIEQNPDLATAMLPAARIKELGFVNDDTGPAFEGGASINPAVAEDAAAGQVVFTAKASDPTAGVTYALTGSSDFAIDAQTGEVTLLGALDYETLGLYSFTITATDFWGNTSSQTVDLAVTDVNEAPVAADPLVDQTAIVGQPFTYKIAAESFSDPDAGTTLTYSATLANGSPLPTWLSFDAATGTFSATSPQELASPVTVTVTASDGSLTASNQFTLGTISAPAVTAVRAEVPAARSGQDIGFALEFSENVIVDGDLANVTITFGDGAFTATGVSQSLGNVLLFMGTIPEGDFSQIALTDITLNGVTITGETTGQPLLTEKLGQTVPNFVIDNTRPTITSTSLEAAENGTEVATLTADEEVEWSLDGTLADNPLFDLSPAGVLTFKEAQDFEGGDTSFDLAVIVEDRAGNVTFQLVTVELTNVNEAPQVSRELVDQTAVVGQAFSYAFASDSFDDPDAGTDLTYTATLADGSALPAWLTFDAASRTFSASAAANLASPITVRVTASDGSLSVYDEFTLNTITAPQVTAITANTDAAKNGDTVTFTVTLSEAVTLTGKLSDVIFSFNDDQFSAVASNQVSGNTFAFTASMPIGDFNTVTLTGITLNSGTTIVGDSSGEGLLTDAVGQTVSDFVIDNTVPTVTSTSVTAAENDTAVATLTANEDVTWALNGTSGDNAQFTLSSAGVLTFNAAKDYETDAKSYSVAVTATDSAGNTTNQTVTVNLTDVNETPVVANPLVDQAAVVGQAYSYTIPTGSFTDPDADTTLTYTATLSDGSALPAWLSFNASTGTFSSANPPSLDAAITVRVTASDGSLTASDEFTLDTVSAPAFSTNLNGVTNLDVRSNLVFTASENIGLTTEDGTYQIVISNDANSTGKEGYYGDTGETDDHTQTIEVTVSSGVASATVNGTAVTLSDVLTTDGNKLVINPYYDLDFANNYHVEISAGLFEGTTSGQGNVALSTGATFATVTPNTNGSGASLVSNGTASQMMNDADGSLVAGKYWIGLDNVGNTAGSTPMDLGSLAADGYAFVATDRNPDPADPGTSLGIGTWDFWVKAEGFGADDLIYIDNQVLDRAGDWNLEDTYFADGEYSGNYYTRIEFDTSDGGTGINPSSSQAWFDVYVDGTYYMQPSDIQNSFGTTEPVFAGG
ncbi:putative Ig domain-containing protein [Aurantiacibacter suaedae]|uniref:putative Ig domain-containing protein n=1 Tax=Aurantiacibacter suaedae TaxID=2545755 RepID=UPI0010F8F3AC|nr:putative Ig domain-containing protein [Aurantiacibacter suaedae]